MKNEYGYMVVKSNVFNIPMHIVETTTTLRVSCLVFSSARDAKEWIRTMKDDLKAFGIDVEYNPDFEFCSIPEYYMNAKTLFSKVENHQMYTFG